jgi:T-complex protein 1 subunit zeta
LIAKASTAQNDETGDGTTSTVLIIGELLRQAEIYINDGLHPRLIADGFDLAKKHALKVLNEVKVPLETVDHQSLIQVAQTALRTKIGARLADQLAVICVDAIEAIKQADNPVDLHMVEIMEMRHRSEEETQLIRGLVLDHGPRHPDMKKSVTNAFILTCNVSLEYEKTTVNAGFFYKSAEEREKLVAAEREFIDLRVQKVIALKNQVCTDPSQTFVLVNQQGIDPTSLDMLAKAGIVAIRRAKRRNMERLTLACGGSAVNSFEDVSVDMLGYAGQVYEYALGDEKYTFIEDVKNPKSVTILIKATNKHTLTQIKDAVHDGLRAIKNTLDDKSLVPGAGAFEVAAHASLLKYKAEVKGKAQLGVQAFADALLIIPKTLAANAGHDSQDVIVKLSQEYAQTGLPVGIDLKTGDAIVPADQGIFDNFKVKKQLLNSWFVVLFLFDFTFLLTFQIDNIRAIPDLFYAKQNSAQLTFKLIMFVCLFHLFVLTRITVRMASTVQ